MSKRRGLSGDEKRERLLEVYREHNCALTLKDVEKFGSKEKGIVLQTIKDVNQGLLDDGLILSDKIGTSVYFWCFSSHAYNTRKRKVDLLTKQVDEATSKLKRFKEDAENLANGREATDDRKAKLAQLAELQEAVKAQKKELSTFSECDPEALKELVAGAEQALAAANRWTDNVFQVRTFCTDKMGIDNERFNKEYGINDAFDFLS